MNREIIDKLFEINNQLTDIENLIEILTKYCELSEEDYSKITVLLFIIQKQICLLICKKVFSEFVKMKIILRNSFLILRSTFCFYKVF